MLFLVLFACANVVQLTAEDYWADINFTLDSVFWGQGTTPPQPNNQNYTDRTFGDYLINGFFGRFNATLQKVNSENLSENFIMSWRLSNNAANQLVFPRYDNIKRLKIHFFNTNPNIGGSIRLQYNSAPVDNPVVWTDFDPEILLDFAADNVSTSTTVIDTLLNLGTTQLRIAPAVYGTGTGNKWIQVYAVSISGEGVPTSNVNNKEMDQLQLNLSGRSLKVTGVDTQYNASVFNLAGVRIGHFSGGEIFTFVNPGVYMVKIETRGKSTAQKVLVL